MTAMAVRASQVSHVPQLSWPRVGAWSGSFSLHILVLALLLIPPVALQLKRSIPAPPMSTHIIEVTPPPPAVPDMPTVVRHQAPTPVRHAAPTPVVPVVDTPSEMAVPVRITDAPPAIDSKPAVPDSEPSAITYGKQTRVPYPRESLANREQGTVTLRVLVGVDGLPQTIEVQKSSGYLRLDRAARDAVRSWNFHPAMHNGVASSAWALVPVTFNLQAL